MKLLIVDDSAKISEMLKQLFATHFSEIRHCDDGLSAIEEYEGFEPEWVFMDIKMKKMDGLKAAKQIKSIYPQAKIIILTSYDSNHFRKEAEAAGAVDYVLKDNIESIFEIIKQNNPKRRIK